MITNWQLHRYCQEATIEQLERVVQRVESTVEAGRINQELGTNWLREMRSYLELKRLIDSLKRGSTARA